MSRREHLLQSAEDNERRSARIRRRFGLATSENQDQVTDWLLTRGAIPAAIAAITLLLYLAVSLFVGP